MPRQVPLNVSDEAAFLLDKLQDYLISSILLEAAANSSVRMGESIEIEDVRASMKTTMFPSAEWLGEVFYPNVAQEFKAKKSALLEKPNEAE